MGFRSLNENNTIKITVKKLFSNDSGTISRLFIKFEVIGHSFVFVTDCLSPDKINFARKYLFIIDTH